MMLDARHCRAPISTITADSKGDDPACVCTKGLWMWTFACVSTIVHRSALCCAALRQPRVEQPPLPAARAHARLSGALNLMHPHAPGAATHPLCSRARAEPHVPPAPAKALFLNMNGEPRAPSRFITSVPHQTHIKPTQPPCAHRPIAYHPASAHHAPHTSLVLPWV